MDSWQCFQEGKVNPVTQLRSWTPKDESDYLANFVYDLGN